jgi:hypothetical protein
MGFIAASRVSVFCFLFIVWSVAAALVSGVYYASRKSGANARRRAIFFGFGLAAWLGFLAFLIKSGFLAAAPLPRLPILFLFINVVTIAAGLSPLGKLLSGLSFSLLVGFQSFRLPLELVLHSWAKQGTIPSTMTWTGQNLDIISGVVAIICAPLADRNRKAAWFANIVGIILLLNVMRVALMSSPLPFGWHLDRPLMLAFHLPYALIVPVCVGGALFGHIVLTRKLLKKT